MPNDFSEDADCMALWRFEPSALTVDSKGANTLTNINAVAENAVDVWEGAGSADFEQTSTQYFSIPDADLDADFPLKSGDVNKKISVCGAFQLESFNTAWRGLFSKLDTNGLRSLSIGIQQTSGQFVVVLGYNNGNSGETLYQAGSLVTGRFYHFGFTFQDSDKSWKLVVWDDTAGSKVINTSGTATNNISVGTAAVGIGVRYFATGTPVETFDGEIDEIVVFKDILTTGEIDLIRQGGFGPVDRTVVAGIGIEAEVGTNWPGITAGIGVSASVLVEQEAAIEAGIGIETVVNTEAYPVITAGIGIEAEVAVFNWAEWIAIYGSRFTARYYCTLTGAPDGLADIELPMSSFQYRLRDNTPSYLQVVIPRIDDAQDIADRSNGDLLVEMAYLVDGVEQHREQLARVDLDPPRSDEGTRRQSITLSGHRTETWGAQIVTLRGITYQGDYNGLIRIRCAMPDLWLRPGDTVHAGDETFVAGKVLTAMSKKTHWMEVVEAA
ncbi:hypothetical protein LCGC14_0775610 [marine sediment metagenome]|uniref:Uncharacterized protein n=1 Tax=marine sediment metagenome TaxID=412755 RepID=A0A0F9SGY0_9ZZZZ